MQRLGYWRNIRTAFTVLKSQRQESSCGSECRLRYVTEDFVALLDVDDLWTPDKISVQLEAWSKNPCSLIVTDFARGDPLLHDWKSAWDTEGYQHVTTGCAFEALLQENFILRSSVLVPTNVLKDLNGFDESSVEQTT